MLGGTTEEEDDDCVRHLRAASALPGQPAQSLIPSARLSAGLNRTSSRFSSAKKEGGPVW